MATYTDALGFDKGSTAGIPDKGIRKTAVLEVDLDFAAITAARLAAGATALANGDILEVLRIPAKTFVIAAGMDVTTAEGATCTVDIGDGTDGDGFLDGVNANTVASYAPTQALAEATPNTVVGYSFGKYYAAADTIDLTMVNAMDTAVVRVWAIVVNVG